MTRPASYLLVAGIFGLHNLEEGLGATRMLEFMRSRGPESLQAFYSTTSPGQLRFGLVLLTLLGLLVALVACRKPMSTGRTHAMLVFCAVINLNALAHLGLSVAFGYMPGLVTAALVCLPMSAWLLWRAYRQRWVPAALGWMVAPAAVLVHGPVLFALLSGVGALYRALGGSAA